MAKTKGKKQKQYKNDNLVESLRGILSGVGEQTADLSKSVINLDNWDEYLGLEKKGEKNKHQGDLSEGQELNLKELSEKKQEKAHVEPGIDYAREIVHVGERLVNRESQEMEGQLRELMAEIKKLADSSKELQMQFKEVAVEQHAVKPGKYHKTFFSWLLTIVRIARMKVEDSGAWLAAMQSKKKSREYGEMSKKHGTGFTLSNERNVATQVG